MAQLWLAYSQARRYRRTPSTTLSLKSSNVSPRRPPASRVPSMIASLFQLEDAQPVALAVVADLVDRLLRDLSPKD